jgi:hypothetical protein
MLTSEKEREKHTIFHGPFKKNSVAVSQTGLSLHEILGPILESPQFRTYNRHFRTHDLSACPRGSIHSAARSFRFKLFTTSLCESVISSSLVFVGSVKFALYPTLLLDPI